MFFFPPVFASHLKVHDLMVWWCTPWQYHQLQDPFCYNSWKKARRLDNKKSNTRLIAKLGNMNTKQWRKEWSQVLFCSFMLAIHCNNLRWLYRGCRAQVVRTFSLYLRPRSSTSLAPQKGNSPPTSTCIVLWCLSNFKCLISEEAWGCLEEALELQKSPVARLCEAKRGIILVLPRHARFYDMDDTYLTTTCAPKQKTRGGLCRVASHIMTIR